MATLRPCSRREDVPPNRLLRLPAPARSSTHPAQAATTVVTEGACQPCRRRRHQPPPSARCAVRGCKYGAAWCTADSSIRVDTGGSVVHPWPWCVRLDCRGRRERGSQPPYAAGGNAPGDHDRSALVAPPWVVVGEHAQRSHASFGLLLLVSLCQLLGGYTHLAARPTSLPPAYTMPSSFLC
jgi:hypothetical protein